MEREISSVTWLAVALITVSIVIGLVMNTVYLGNKTKNQAIEYSVDLIEQMETSEIKELKDSCKDLPMISIYSILTRNYTCITELDIYDYTSEVNKTTVANAIDDFVANEDNLAYNTLANVNAFKPNTNGMWSLNGNPGDSNQSLFCYEIIENCNGSNLLNGRAYIVASKLKDGNYKISILKYQ